MEMKFNNAKHIFGSSNKNYLEDRKRNPEMLKRERERRSELMMTHQWHWDPLRGKFSLERGVSHPKGNIGI